MRVSVSLMLFVLFCEFGSGQNGQAPAMPERTGTQILPRTDAQMISSLESKVDVNPDDLISRGQLLRLYMQEGSEANFMRHLTWSIRNHPEDRSLTMSSMLRPQGGSFNTMSDYQEVAALWDAQVATHPDSPGVLLNEASFLTMGNPERALDLLEQARKLDATSQAYLQAEVSIYRLAMIPAFRPDRAEAVKAKLMSSNDPELLGATGQMLARTPSSKEMGILLLEKAASLDPGNQRWSAGLSDAQKPQLIPTGPVTIGGRVAEANLIQKVEPQYPALAESARISGTVEFTVTIGEDGLVKNILLVRGHPLLVNAAKDAVTQWKYRPTLLNGTPVAVMTDVVVPFNLVQ